MLGSLIVTKTVDELTGVFKAEVIDKWQNYRARQFLEQLAKTWIEEKEKDKETPQLDQILKHFSDERYSEILFESYRKVCLSASRELGPRIIALITSMLLKEGRVADEFEDMMLTVAEQFRDTELRKFASVFKAAISNRTSAGLVEFTQGVPRALDQETEVVLEFDLNVATRSLVKKLINLGVALEVSLHTVDSDRRGVIVVPKAMTEFVELIDRTTGPTG